VTARRGDAWQTTQETAWAVMAFSDWMRATGEADSQYSYDVRLNADALIAGQATPETARETVTATSEAAALAADAPNRLIISRGEGPGALYYSAFLRLELPAEEVSAISRGITVTRDYFIAGDRNQPASSATVGDVITVRLTLTLPEDVFFLTVESPYPAGTEPVDTSLLTTSISAESPSLRGPLTEDPFFYWNWYWFDQTTLRDDRAVLTTNFLPRGTYVYSYQVRASIPGTFQTLPAQAYATYQPEVFGRTDGQTFTIAGDS
jgi:hypothetical protein